MKKSNFAIISWLKKESEDTKILLRSIPSILISIFILSVVCANLMANKELVSYKYFALDCGFAFSWIMFLCMDIICKRWNARATIKISLITLLVNLAVCLCFYLLSKAPGMWGEYYSFESASVNKALNNTFGGSWYVVLGSALAFMASSIVNALLNSFIGKMILKKSKIKKNGFTAFALRSYISTIVAQYVDNFIFATVVSKVFFGWTWTQVVICSAAGAVAELLAEILFSGFGYKIAKRWEKENVGKQYFDYIAARTGV